MSAVRELPENPKQRTTSSTDEVVSVFRLPAVRSLPLILLAILAFNFYFIMLFSRSKANEIAQAKQVLTQASEVEQKAMDELYVELENEFRATGLLADVELLKVPGGMAIILSETNFFDRGQIDLRDSAEKKLAAMASFINAKEKIGFWLLVEGHTDDIPIVQAMNYFRTNWELSGARAASALRIFVETGFPQNRVLLMGFGDSRPLLPNRNEDGKPLFENQAKNRRIVIKLLRKSWLSGIFSE